MSHERIDQNDPLLKRIRALIARFPETREGEIFGHPIWKSGTKIMASYGRGDDGKTPWLSFKADPFERGELLADPRFKPTPYMHQHGFVSINLSGKPSWKEVERLLETSFRMVAPKRAIRVLDEE